MNEHDDTTLDASLRLQLRGLRRELPPQSDLWPGIQARIAAAPAAAPAPVRRAPNVAPWALAASLVLSLGIAWHLQPPAAPGATSADAGRPLVDREAAAMTREYRAALLELQASTPVSVAGHPAQPDLRELDRSARQIRDAIDRDPAATYLLDRLRRTYTLRLEVTQRSFAQAARLG